MSLVFVAVLAIAVAPSDGATPSATAAVKAAADQPAPTPRTGRELADAAHATMQHWAKATDREADQAARDLLTIYGELQNDAKLARSQRESLRVTVRGRLDQLSTQISKRVAKETATAKLGKNDKPGKAESGPKSVAAKDATAVLGQGGIAMGGGGAGYGGGNGGAGGNASADNGEMLVDLIQNVISPKSWEANGGACTIYYWRQQHAIVVRATGDVHSEISDTLEQLNRATH